MERKERMLWGKGGGEKGKDGEGEGGWRERKGWCVGEWVCGEKGKDGVGGSGRWYVVRERVDIMWVERKDKERWGGEGNGKGGAR